MKRFRQILWAVFSAVAITVSATTIHVPDEAPTIQAGLDSLHDGDTVLVALGTYIEALVAPPLHFVLRGDVVPDTGDYPRPVINPTSLPGPDTLACLTLPAGSHPVIADLVLKNGPDPFHWHVRGIRSAAQDVTLRRIVMDSLFYGFVDRSLWPALITVDSCHFQDLIGDAIFTMQSSVVATDCEFIDCRQHGGSTVWAWRHSRIRRCHFASSIPAGAFQLLVTGSDVIVEDCLFGPGLQTGSGPLSIIYASGMQLLNNVFVGCTEGQTVVDVICDEEDAVEFTGNALISCQSIFAAVLYAHYMPTNAPRVMLISDNLFVQCNGGSWGGNAITSYVPAGVNRNRFFHFDRHDLPAIFFATSAPDSFIQLRDNMFYDTRFALENQFGGLIDARWNWWGDSTGPFHPMLNPNGQGEQVGDNILFDPWYPDTSFLEEARRIQAPLPDHFTLDAYPNPFNSTVTLKLIPNEVMIIKVELFDILGRRVKELWSGPIAYEKEITFDGSNISSGIYFVRVWQPIGNRPRALTKLVLLK